MKSRKTTTQAILIHVPSNVAPVAFPRIPGAEVKQETVEPTYPHHKMLQERIDEILACLDAREQEIIKLRYGLKDGYNYTIAECAYIFKIAGERVRQLEARALRKLQQPSRRVAKNSKV